MKNKFLNSPIRSIPLSLFLLSIFCFCLGAGISAYKTMMLGTDNTLPSNETTFFAVNSNLLNAAVAPPVLPGVMTLTNSSVGGPVTVENINVGSGNLAQVNFNFAGVPSWEMLVGPTIFQIGPTSLYGDAFAVDLLGNLTTLGNLVSPSNVITPSITLGTNAAITNWPAGGSGGASNGPPIQITSYSPGSNILINGTLYSNYANLVFWITPTNNCEVTASNMPNNIPFTIINLADAAHSGYGIFLNTNFSTTNPTPFRAPVFGQTIYAVPTNSTLSTLSEIILPVGTNLQIASQIPAQ